MKFQAWHVYTCVNAAQVFRSKASKYASCKFSIRDSMSSKTILVVLSIFQCGSEKSGAWTTSPNDCQSDRTKDFAAWSMGIY